MIRLQAALREHGESIEADLQRYYGVALSDVFTGRMSWRRLKVLLRQLPPDSATGRAQLGPAVDWSTSDYLLAAVVDAERAALWQRSGGRGRRPKPVPRPGVGGGTRLGRTTRPAAQVRTYLARFRPPPPAYDPAAPQVHETPAPPAYDPATDHGDEVEVNGGR
jgi:hypothetical protein